MIFVIYGEESFLMEQKLQSLKKEYDCNEDTMEYFQHIRLMKIV